MGRPEELLRLASIEDRVAALEFDATIRGLFATYCQALDERDVVRLEEVFAPGAAMLAGGNRVEGRAAILKFCQDQWQRRDWARHVVGLVRQEGFVDDTSVAAAPFCFVSRAGDRARTSFGSYRAIVVRGGDACRFVELEVHVEFDVNLDLPASARLE
jgi:SnoaL-like domain